MNFSKLFLMMALGMSLNNGACGMEQEDNKRKREDENAEQSKKNKKEYDKAATQELQELLYELNNDFHEEKIKKLLTAGADPNTQDINNSTLLHYAALWDNKEIVEMLLKTGTNLNRQNDDGDTPLHYAVLWGNKEIVTSIINFITNGAQISDNKLAQLEYLCSLNKTFREKCQIFLMNNKRQSGFLKIPKPLCYEILVQSWNPTQCITELVNIKNNNRNTALYVARAKDDEEIETLLEPYETYTKVKFFKKIL